MKKNAVILIGFLPNPRIYKRINLEKELFNVHLICWNRESGMLNEPVENGFQSHCISIAAVNDPIRRIKPYKAFATKAKTILKELNPTVIHVQGLDMLQIAYIYKKFYNKEVHIVYEVPDLHALLIEKQKKIIYKMGQIYLKLIERKYCRLIDLLIVTSEKFYEVYFEKFIPKKKEFYFPNIPNLSVFENYVPKKRKGAFTVGYIGSVRYERQMHNLITAAERLNINLMIAGFEMKPFGIEQRCKNYSKGKWIGNFDFAERASELYGECDVMYAVYEADILNVRLALPNKLYEAVYCEIPLIVAKNTYLAEIVEEWGIGIAVNHTDPEELVTVLEKLRLDDEYYELFCNNCRKNKEKIRLDLYNNKLKNILSQYS